MFEASLINHENCRLTGHLFQSSCETGQRFQNSLCVVTIKKPSQHWRVEGVKGGGMYEGPSFQCNLFDPESTSLSLCLHYFMPS